MDLPFRLYIGHIPAEEVGRPAKTDWLDGCLYSLWTLAFTARDPRISVTQGG